jgi:Uma2 family endonuclease
MSMGMEVNTNGLTYESLLLLPDDGKRHEVIGGELYVTPSPITVHQRFARDLGYVLHSFVVEHDLGEVFFAPLDVYLSPSDIVQPDLLFISNSRMGCITDNYIQGAPDLVVEVISESTRRTDRKIKLRLYESFDVIEYWLADPVVQTIEVYSRNQENRLVRTAEYEETDTLSSDLFPGLVINVADLWVDRRKNAE